MIKSQRTELNVLLHELLRLRDGEKCQKCGKTENLQLSHIFPKGRHRKMEFDEENIQLLCYACHFHFFHKNPIEAKDWLKSVLPAKRWRNLQFRANTIDKSVVDYKLLKIYLTTLISKYARK